MASHVPTVQRIYQAFATGDIPAILAVLSDDVRWEHWRDHSAHRLGYALLAPRTGRAGVQAFFQEVGRHTVNDFRVLDITGDDRLVAAEIEITLTNGDTGKRLHDEELHLWSFDTQGRVTRLRHYVDTAKHLDAAGLLSLKPEVAASA